MGVAAEFGPEVAEDFGAGGLGVEVVAGGDAVDEVEAVFEVVEDEEEGLWLGC